MSKNSFIHLHVHNCFSLLDGLGTHDKFIEKTKELGLDTLAETNHGSCGGAFWFYNKCVKNNIKPIMGVEAYVVEDHLKKEVGDVRNHLIILAKNANGLKNIFKIMTEANLNGFYYKPRVSPKVIFDNHQDLIILSACSSSYITNPILRYDNEQDGKAECFRRCEQFAKVFKDDFYLEFEPFAFPEQIKVNKMNLELSQKLNIKCVATNDVHYLSKEYVEAHDVLLLMQSKSTINNRGWEFSVKDLYLKTREEMYESFKTNHSYLQDKFINQILDETLKINDKIDIKLDYSKFIFPKFPLPQGFTDSYEYMKHLIKLGLRERGIKDLQKIDPEKYSTYIKRLEYELDIIHKKGFIDYFLIVQDFINFAKNNDIATGIGRGSCGGSLLAYLLKIMEVDPLKFGLLYERFLNPERCLIPNTKVLTSKGIKTLKKLQVGNLVLTNNGLYKKVLNKVINKSQKIIKITYNKKNHINCSEDHRFYVFRDFKFILIKAKDILNTDKLVGESLYAN